MFAYIVLFAAVLSRLLPHTFHHVGLNFTAVGGSLLFFGARQPRWQAVFATPALMATDVYLTTQVYGMAFHVQGYLITWAWYACVCLLGGGLLRKVTLLRTALAVVTSSLSFFVLSNFAVWMGGSMYPHSGAGLAACYAAGLPFYQNDVVSTALTVTFLFGVPALGTRLVVMMDAGKEAPLA